MTGIGGPTGPGGIGGPAGVGDVGGADAADALDAADGLDAAAHTTAASGTGGIDALIGELASGRITPEQLVDRLIGDQASVAGLSADERADLVEVMNDLVAHDPHLQDLLGALR